MYIYIYICMHACMHACMHGCMYVCMYVCIYKGIIYKYVSVCISWQVYMYVYIFASNRNTNDDHEYHYNPKKNWEELHLFPYFNSNPRKNGQSKVQKPAPTVLPQWHTPPAPPLLGWDHQWLRPRRPPRCRRCWCLRPAASVQIIWLVVDLPLWKICSSVGMMTFQTEWENKIHVPNHQPVIN